MIVTAAIRVAAAGLGAAVAGPLGGALGGWVGEALGQPASALIGKYAEQFGEKSAEKLLDSGADSLVERFRRPGTSLQGVYRDALRLSLEEIHAQVPWDGFDDWFENWEACLGSSSALNLDAIASDQLVADNLETLFRSTMERLDAQGSAILRGDLSLTLAVRTMDQALLSNLSSRLPDRLRKNFPDLLVKSENETAWKQSQLVFEEYTRSALTRVEAKQDQLILILTDEMKRAREDGRIARQQADTAQADLAKLTEAYRELLEKLTASPAQPAQQALSQRLAAGDLAGAVELKTKQVQSETDERDRQNDKLAQDQFELGTLHALRFDWPKALEAFREAWKLKHDPSYGAAYADYAKRQGQFDQAAAVYDALLAMPLDPADTAAVLNDQANLFSGMLRMREAEQAYHKALSIQRSLAAADPEIYRPEMALTLSNIAVFYRTTQRLREAEQALEESLSIRRELARTDPDDHVPEVATTLHNLAVLYVTTQRVNEAEAAFEEALSIRRRLAKAQPDAYAADVASTLRDLANLYSDTQRSIDAEPAYCDALATYRRLAEANPEGFLPDVATTLHNLAILYHNTRRISQAESDYKEALAIRWRLAKTHPEVYLPEVAASLNALAVLYRSSNRLTEAEQTFKEALAIRRELAQASPEAHLGDLATALNNLAVIYRETERNDEAEKTYQEALAIRRDLAKANPAAYLPDVVMTLNNLGILYEDSGRLQEAETYCREAGSLLEPLWRTNPELHGDQMARILVVQAQVWSSLGRSPNEAYALAQRAHEIAYEENLKRSVEWLMNQLASK